VELAYAFVAEYWNWGLAAEMAEAILGGSLREARPDGRRPLHAPDNRASRRVMEKAEFGYERDVAHTGQPHVLYCITARR
jgi:RimJ/RimL family protein N-acetyltransferase